MGLGFPLRAFVSLMVSYCCWGGEFEGGCAGVLPNEDGWLPKLDG